jgi:hypothetical protein
MRTVNTLTSGTCNIVQSELKQTVLCGGGSVSFSVEKFAADHREWANIRYTGPEHGLKWLQFVACTVYRRNKSTDEVIYYETDKSAGAVVTDFRAIYGEGHFEQFADVRERGGERRYVVPYSNPECLQWVTDTVNASYEYGGRRSVQSKTDTSTEMW